MFGQLIGKINDNIDKIRSHIFDLSVSYLLLNKINLHIYNQTYQFPCHLSSFISN